MNKAKNGWWLFDRRCDEWWTNRVQYRRERVSASSKIDRDQQAAKKLY